MVARTTQSASQRSGQGQQVALHGSSLRTSGWRPESGPFRPKPPPKVQERRLTSPDSFGQLKSLLDPGGYLGTQQMYSAHNECSSVLGPSSDRCQEGVWIQQRA